MARFNMSEDVKNKLMADARRIMSERLGSTAKGREAGARVAMAFTIAIQRAQDPMALLKCNPDSVLSCMIASADTDLMPGGPYPRVFLTPRGGELQWEINHRGIATLAQREGIKLRAVPVHIEDDTLELEFGEVTAHNPSPDLWPNGLDEMRGVYVIIKRLSDGANLGRPWVPIGLIRKRASSPQAGPVWKTWPVEMAQKTAIKYLIARGELVIDSSQLDAAFEAEERGAIDVESHRVASAASTLPSGRSALGLPDHGEQIDPLAGVDPRDEDRGEVIPVEPEAQAEAQAEQSATPSAREQLLISITELEDALLEAKGSDAVDAAQKAAKVDGKKLDSLTDQQIKGYRLELRTRVRA